jgi:hypothetical protein
VDIVIASTILARVTVTTATPTLSVTGTLKAALIGATTSIVIETASGILFLNTAEVVIGSTTVVSANVNTATDNDALQVLWLLLLPVLLFVRMMPL